jgi:GTP-binding protein
MVQGRIARLRYAHMGGKLPPRIIIHGNRTDTLPDSYKRYLENTFSKAFKLVGTPVFLEFRGGGNPYQGRKNKLTDRQIAKRKRLKKWTDRKKAKRR